MASEGATTEAVRNGVLHSGHRCSGCEPSVIIGTTFGMCVPQEQVSDMSRLVMVGG